MHPHTEPAPAKINLFLHITGRRADGYHLLQSLMVFAPAAADSLRAEPAADLSLSLEGPMAEGLDAQDNLVMRAALALQAVASAQAGAALTLEKNLPVASGIGGGSADAAAALRLLMRLWNVRLPQQALHTLALSLGSDVAACLASRPVFAEGVGEHLTPAPLPFALPMVVVNPGVAISTREIFSHIRPPYRPPLPGLPRFADVEALAAWLQETHNDLAPPARQLAPVIDDVMAALQAQAGCLLARMSGSGATCFGLFKEPSAAAEAAQAISAHYPGWWVQTV